MREELFSAWWPKAKRTARAALRADHGTNPIDIDDLLQHTAEQALRSDREFESERQFTRWCVKVAKNADIDRLRHGRKQLIGGVIDRRTDDGVEDVVTALLLRERLESEIARLSDHQRKVLFHGAAAFPAELRDRINKQRSRLRQYLYRVVSGLLGGMARLGARLTGRLPDGSAASAAAAALVIAAGAVSGVAWRQHDSHTAPGQAATTQTPTAHRDSPTTLRADFTEPNEQIESALPWSATTTPSRATIAIPAWPDKDGNPQSIDYGPAKPGEERVLICGVNTAISSICLQYPEWIVHLGKWSHLGALLP